MKEFHSSPKTFRFKCYASVPTPGASVEGTGTEPSEVREQNLLSRLEEISSFWAEHVANAFIAPSPPLTILVLRTLGNIIVNI